VHELLERGTELRAVVACDAGIWPLFDELWDPARVADMIATIDADGDAASDPDALWARGRIGYVADAAAA
jgi:hypothetical protein